MTYRSDLGANIVSPNSGFTSRSFLTTVQTRPATPAPPPVLIRPAPIFTPSKPTSIGTPVKPTTPVLKLTPKVTPSQPLEPPVFKAAVTSGATTKPSSTVSMKPVATSAIVTERTDGLLGKFVSSPLPLIAFGIGALLLFNRKKGR
jgi:hypothetical protein